MAITCAGVTGEASSISTGHRMVLDWNLRDLLVVSIDINNFWAAA
jgi:hypothetical protein